MEKDENNNFVFIPGVPSLKQLNAVVQTRKCVTEKLIILTQMESVTFALSFILCGNAGEAFSWVERLIRNQ